MKKSGMIFSLMLAGMMPVLLNAGEALAGDMKDDGMMKKDTMMKNDGMMHKEKMMKDDGMMHKEKMMKDDGMMHKEKMMKEGGMKKHM